MLGVIILIIQAAGSLQIQQGVARSLPDHTFTDPAAKKALISTGFIFSVGTYTLWSVCRVRLSPYAVPVDCRQPEILARI